MNAEEPSSASDGNPENDVSQVERFFRSLVQRGELTANAVEDSIDEVLGLVGIERRVSEPGQNATSEKLTSDISDALSSISGKLTRMEGQPGIMDRWREFQEKELGKMPKSADRKVSPEPFFATGDENCCGGGVREDLRTHSDQDLAVGNGCCSGHGGHYTNDDSVNQAAEDETGSENERPNHGRYGHPKGHHGPGHHGPEKCRGKGGRHGKGPCKHQNTEGDPVTVLDATTSTGKGTGKMLPGIPIRRNTPTHRGPSIHMYGTHKSA